MKRKLNGAISLFMVIVTLSSFMLGGVFIDAARIRAAENKVHQSMNTAARSAMSYYNEALVENYGLYGIDRWTLYDNFLKYFVDNMKNGEYEGINLFKYDINVRNCTMVGTVKFSDSMGKQILEYEKYRAPVTTTIALVDRIKSAVQNMMGKSDLVNEAKDSVSSLNDQFKDSKNILKQAGKSIKNNFAKRIADDVVSFASNVLDNTAKTICNNIKNTTKTQIDNVRAEIKNMEKERDKLKAKKEEYIETNKQLSQVYDAGTTQVTDTRSEEAGTKEKKKYDGVVDQMTSQIDSLNSSIEQLTQSVNSIENRLNQKTNELETLINNYQAAVHNREAKEQELEETEEYKKQTTNRKNYQNFINSSTKFDRDLNSFFTGLTLTDEQKQDYENYKAALSVNDITMQNELVEKYKDDENLSKLLGDYKTSFDNANEIKAMEAELQRVKGVIESYTNEINDLKAIENDWKTQVDSKKDELVSIANELKNLSTPSLEEVTISVLEKSAKDYVEGENTLAGQIKEFAEQMAGVMPEIGNGNDEDETDEKGLFKVMDNVIDQFKAFADVITNIENMRNQIYYIDYIMNNCTYLTSKVERSHHFNYAEVEYIIFGHDTQIANITSALTSIYLLRFAIDAVSYFFNPKAPPEILSRIGYALGRGAAQAAFDLKDMVIDEPLQGVEGKGAPGCALFPSFDKIRLSYSDHLRILLLMKGANALPGLERTINSTLTEKLKEKGTAEFFTSAKASVEVEVNLIMIPVFASIIPNGGRFKDGKYIIRDSVELYY